MVFVGCSSLQKRDSYAYAFQTGRILLVYSGEKRQAVKARFEWIESYENGKRSVTINIFDLWGNHLFKTLKETNLTNSLSSNWHFFLYDGNIVDDFIITREIFRLLKMRLTQAKLFKLLDEINELISESRKYTKNNVTHKMKKTLERSEISVKIIFD